MARYRRAGVTGIDQRVVDPGKDLFAYLFILIMVFSFMLLMTTEERHARRHQQRAPESTKASRSQLAEIAFNAIGRLEKDGGEVAMFFAGHEYFPLHDLKKLTADGRITVSKTENGEVRQVIYLSTADADKLSLAEYLAAFSFLGEHGINVAFADKVN